jgi:hypothetical protein
MKGLLKESVKDPSRRSAIPVARPGLGMRALRGGQRRAQDVATQLLQTRAIGGHDPGGRVRREAPDSKAQRVGALHHALDVGVRGLGKEDGQPGDGAAPSSWHLELSGGSAAG